MTAAGTSATDDARPLVGILGGGQLGRMLALAGHSLGIATRCWDEQADAVAGHVTQLHADAFGAPARLDDFLRGLTVVTTEWENVPVALLRLIASRGVQVHPNPQAVAIAQDRWLEKEMARRLGIATPAYAHAGSVDELQSAVAQVSASSSGACIIKTRRLGYDGKGQALLRRPSPADVTRAWDDLTGGGAVGRVGGLIVESLVPFARELSIIAVRGVSAEVRCYPLTVNVHRAGILRRSVAPAPGVTPALQHQAEALARRVLDELHYVGVLAIELFEVPGAHDAAPGLVFNEIAPRVHNSGHWTIDGARTSQFENHLRAITGLPLGSCEMVTPGAHAGMANLIGAMPARERVLAIDGARLHDYAKPARAGRKLGHVNVVASSDEELEARLRQVEALIAE